ncbi:amino acid adenylation domain-containing protein [Kitasatospora sp. NPDC004240]
MTRSIFRQLRAAALRSPSRPALTAAGATLTAAELSLRAEAVGRHLVARGIGPGDRVGVLVERGVELVVALFGVSAAGAAYVPLDPGYPAGRLRTVVEDAGLSALLTDAAGPPAGAPDYDGPRIGLPLTPADLAGVALTGAVLGPADDPAPGDTRLPVPRPEDPAYVIYTSGSTGRPKGVVVTQANVAAFLDALDTAYGVPEGGDRFLAVTSVSFDIALMELVWPVTRGGLSAVAPAGLVHRLGAGDEYGLPALVARHRPTLLQATPSLLSAVAAHPEALRSLRTLRALAVGGESFPPGLARRLAGALPGVRIVNMYGPTEATVWCSAHELTAEDLRRPTIPIGRALGHARLRIVDEAGREVPPGVAGELRVGGPCVAEGYLHRPELTRERFPTSDGPGRPRWYRTGDRALQRPDGVVEFIGRLDRQVKVSGVRIELDEIEAALSTSPDVRAAAVVPRQGPDGRPTLVAYVERPSPSTH